MMLRLVLVGMVAAMGVSIPSQPNGGNVFESAQAWTTSLLAEWDTWEPDDDTASELAGARGHLACEQCRLARLRVASSAALYANGDPPAPKPTEKDAAARSTIARVAGQGVELAGPPSALARQLDQSESRPSQPLAASFDPFEPIGISEVFETGTAYELNGPAEPLETRHAISPATVAKSIASEEDLAADAFELGIWSELYWYTNTNAPAAVATCSEFETSDETTVSCLDEEWDPVGGPEEAPVITAEASSSVSFPIDVFTPAPKLASAPVPAAAQATAVVQAGEGASAVKFPEDVFTPPVFAQRPLQSGQPLAGNQSQPPRLGDAVELTRRAVSAWVSVLIGPALVDGSRR